MAADQATTRQSDPTLMHDTNQAFMAAMPAAQQVRLAAAKAAMEAPAPATVVQESYTGQWNNNWHWSTEEWNTWNAWTPPNTGPTPDWSQS